MERPRLITFDIFGTVLNWFDGLQASAGTSGIRLDQRIFDRVIDQQGVEEQRHFTPYTEIAAKSFVQVLGMRSADAIEVGKTVGCWPLFSDSAQGLQALMKIAPCVAMSNSDYVHGEQVQRQLGHLSHWFCAEEVRVYKPNPEFWNIVSERSDMPFSRQWWHVSAYADYDLEVARRLGLTCVFVERNHNRPGSADLTVKDLRELAGVVSRLN